MIPITQMKETGAQSLNNLVNWSLSNFFLPEYAEFGLTLKSWVGWKSHQ